MKGQWQGGGGRGECPVDLDLCLSSVDRKQFKRVESVGMAPNELAIGSDPIYIPGRSSHSATNT